MHYDKEQCSCQKLHVHMRLRSARMAEEQKTKTTSSVEASSTATTTILIGGSTTTPTATTVIEQRAWLSISDHSYPLLGGVAVIFDGAQILRGVCAPKQAHDSARYRCLKRVCI